MNSRQKRTPPLLGIVALVVPVLAAPAWGQGLSHLWSQGFGGGFLDVGFGIAVDGDGNVLLTGNFRGSVDFGGGPIASAGSDDIFVAKFDADGDLVMSFGPCDGCPEDVNGDGVVNGQDASGVATHFGPCP